MTVLIVENTPDKVRGLLKRWFVEPKPNVFVGSINRRTREKVLQYILKYAPPDLAILAIFDDVNSQGFSIRRYHDTSRIERLITGHYLIATRPEFEPEAGSRVAGLREPGGRSDGCAGECAPNEKSSFCLEKNAEIAPQVVIGETKCRAESKSAISGEKEVVPDPEVVAKTLEILKPCLVFYSLK